MSDSDSAKSGGTTSGSQRTTNAILGIFVLLAIVVLVNFVFNRVSHRFDLTENDIYTLTDGTKDVLKKVEEIGNPVLIRFYAVTDPDYVSQFYLTRAAAVEDFLREYEQRGGGLVEVKRYNPEPFSDDAESAKFDGLPRAGFDDPDNPVYFGLVVESEGRTEVLPFLPARPEELLEYDVTRAILRVADTERKKVGVMTSMDIAGGPPAGFGQPPAPKWYLIQSLEQDYDVEILPGSTTEVPGDVDVLVVLHPYDTTEEAQFAIDQYLLKGGKVVVTVDPMFFTARYMTPAPAGNPMMMQQPQGGPGPQSDLDKLFEAWGVEFDSTKVLADVESGTRLQSGFSPTVLSVPDAAMNSDDPVTRQLSDLFMITPGAFEIQSKAGIESTVLVSTSLKSQLVGVSEADPTSRDQVRDLQKNFQPDLKQRALVARLSGTFQTAFPKGLGGDEASPDSDPDAGAAPAPAPSPKPATPVVPSDDDVDAGAADSDAADKGGDAKKPAAAAPEAKADASAPAKDADGKDDAAASENKKPAADPAPAPAPAAKPETGGPEDDESDPTEETGAEGNGDASKTDGPAPSVPPSLKSSEKEGTVVLFADADFVYDSFAAQRTQNMENGRVEMRPVNGNLALFENTVEQLAGGDTLIRVRSRASNLRPFTRLNKILEDVQEEHRDDLAEVAKEMERIESERGEVEQNILQILSRTASQDGVIKATPELNEEIQKLQGQEEEMAEQMRNWQREEYEVNKAIKREFESQKNLIILVVTFLLPLAVIAFGIGLWVTRRTRTAAR